MCATLGNLFYKKQKQKMKGEPLFSLKMPFFLATSLVTIKYFMNCIYTNVGTSGSPSNTSHSAIHFQSTFLPQIQAWNHNVT